MAKLNNGMFGAPSGKFGKNVIFSSWLGKPYMKSNPGTRAAPNEKEQNNHQSFGTTSWGFINPLKSLLQISFKEMVKGDRGMFAARSYLLKHALEKDAKGNAVLHPERMLISQGSLTPPNEAQVQQTSPTELAFTWDHRVTGSASFNDDQLLLVAYNVEAGEAVSSLGAAYRKDGTATLDISSLPSGTVHLYLGFVSFDRTRASDSVYLGTVEV